MMALRSRQSAAAAVRPVVIGLGLVRPVENRLQPRVAALKAPTGGRPLAFVVGFVSADFDVNPISFAKKGPSTDCAPSSRGSLGGYPLTATIRHADSEPGECHRCRRRVGTPGSAWRATGCAAGAR
jgi:hypothetical protein